MVEKNKMKKIISTLLFLMGTLNSIYIAAYLDVILSKKVEKLQLFNPMEAMKIIESDKKALGIFLVLELGSVLFTFIYYFTKDNFYQSELIEITPEIKIPKASGQGQFGTARFMTKNEKKEMFPILDIVLSDDLMRKLLSCGECEFELIENYNEENLKKFSDKKIKAEKLDRYEIQKNIKSIFENELENFNYFSKMIMDIDESIEDYKKSNFDKLIGEVNKLSSGDEKDELVLKVKKNLDNYDSDIKKEVEKIKSDQVREALKLKLDMFYQEFNKKVEGEILAIKKELNLIKIVDSDDLEILMDKAKSLEKRIGKLPKSDMKTDLRIEVFCTIDQIKNINNLRYKKLKNLI